MWDTLERQAARPNAAVAVAVAAAAGASRTMASAHSTSETAADTFAVRLALEDDAVAGSDSPPRVVPAAAAVAVDVARE
jgi:hypothetical protein